jgi:hypothetical protein
MKSKYQQLDLSQVKVRPLADRQSLSSIDKMLLDPEGPPPACPEPMRRTIEDSAQRIHRARRLGASVMLIYGAHLVKNGALRLVRKLMEGGWVTHLATNGAGTIHDWELSFLGRTEESVRKNVAAGCFGTWDETGRYITLSVLVGALKGEGYGRSLGRFIAEDGAELPDPAALEASLREQPTHALAPARAELLQVMLRHSVPGGRLEVKHPWKGASILARASELDIPFTVHPGIGYDIITTHPMFSGAAIGRGAQLDFASFSNSVDGLDQGVVLSVGSAIMGPQVFEKSLSCVNNLRLQSGRPIVQGHAIYVVDIQDGGGWDWSQGEPPKTNPAYYLRFCKSFARMGGEMNYVQADNVVFLHNLLRTLQNL